LIKEISQVFLFSFSLPIKILSVLIALTRYFSWRKCLFFSDADFAQFNITIAVAEEKHDMRLLYEMLYMNVEFDECQKNFESRQKRVVLKRIIERL
jgi:hypothetical protein